MINNFFRYPMPPLVLGSLIDGSKGPYDKNTSIGKSANAGNEVANLIKSGQAYKLSNTDIQYARTEQVFESNCKDPNCTSMHVHQMVTKNKVNTNDALAYSTEALKGYDINGDGSVSVEEFATDRSSPAGTYALLSEEGVAKANLKAKALDLNDDGKIDAGEYSAYTMFQDGQTINQTFVYDPNNHPYFGKNIVDGKVTANEAKLAEQELNRDPNAVKATLKQIYADNNIAEAQKTFVMPEKVGVVTPPPTDYSKMSLAQSENKRAELVRALAFYQTSDKAEDMAKIASTQAEIKQNDDAINSKLAEASVTDKNTTIKSLDMSIKGYQDSLETLQRQYNLSLTDPRQLSMNFQSTDPKYYERQITITKAELTDLTQQKTKIMDSMISPKPTPQPKPVTTRKNLILQIIQLLLQLLGMDKKSGGVLVEPKTANGVSPDSILL